VSEPLALGLTIVVELPVWVLLLRARLGVPTALAAGVGVAVNVVSHPLLWFVLIPLGEAGIGSTVVAIVVGEAVVVVLETALAAALLAASPATGRPRRARPLLLIAVLANTLSVAVGVVLQAAGVGG
jgi:hypothetical protein